MWKISNPNLRRVSVCMMVVMTWQLVYPLKALALTTGPSQPEVQSFEPVGTTDMVDMFTGDFNYNIPLLDVEGYPINIAYHGGVNGEQESSWVGEGWNINPGVVNRTVRGIPDDFNGDSLMKTVHIKDERNLKIGSSVGAEPAGTGEPILRLSLGLGGFVNISNYRGVSAGIGFDAGVRVLGFASAGVNLGVGSQNGADIDYHAGIGMSSSQVVGSSEASGSISVNYNSGYNSRSSLKDRSWTVSGSANIGGRSMNGPSYSTTVPISLKNYVPVITNSSVMKSWSGNLHVGGEAAWTSIFGSVNAMGSQLHYDDEASRKCYGYLYAQNADDEAINDFSRDKDGTFNKTMKYLPPATQTYDVYSVNGQGTGGSFRPFRNDYGTVYDPVVTSESAQRSGGAEVTLGWLFSGGGNVDVTNTDMRSGPWKGEYSKAFRGGKPGSVYEPYYFKQAGEITKVDAESFNALGGFGASEASLLHTIGDTRKNSDKARSPRANFVSFFTAKEAVVPGVASTRKIYDYKNNPFPSGTQTGIDSFDRYVPGAGSLKRRADNISEVTQVQTDGRRYVYGIPAMNNVQKEMTFAVGGPSSASDMAKGLVAYNPGHDDTKGNGNGLDNFYSATVTPAFAHSYLLTSVLSADYVDIKGDGATEDDYGSYTKFNYDLKDNDYRWRSPIETNKAHYNQGYVSDPRDDRASYMIGSREQWILHSVESKNYVAEFYTSPRLDGKGVKDTITRPEDKGYNQSPYDDKLAAGGNSYKLDSIKLYNKHDRVVNGTSAVPVKTVIFKYDYSLCQHLPNTSATAAEPTGKLTLKRIYFRYGNSDKSMISPYQFNYSAVNPNYNLADKDRWGAYKPNDSTGFTNYEFPYVKQDDPNANNYASAWSLTEIILPSGGSVHVNYEADDYAYVQDKQANEMFLFQGIGNSPNFYAGNKLYNSAFSPNLFLYFKRRKAAEISNFSFAQNYMPADGVVAYTSKTQLTDGKYEPIKGYAQIEAIGVCPNNDDIGYIRLAERHPDKGDANMNPITYTALNVGRYNLPQVIFPGNDPNVSDIMNVIRGMKYAMGELFSMAENPIIRMLGEGKGKDVDLAKSYMRMNSPGLRKKGGGQRVKELLFFDNWANMAGGDARNATYGKQYDYTISYSGDNTNGTRISSGVASYEPMIGGDENPFRMPAVYQAQKGSKFPPNDPVELFQEFPIGESFYPTAIVGYSQVTVTSIHKNEGRSSQAIDVSAFYTARDFPTQFATTGLEYKEQKGRFSIKHQELVLKAHQGYSIVLNDMHGKPKRTEHKVYMPASNTTKLISYQAFNYNGGTGRLDNMVDVLEFDKATEKMKKSRQQLGVETDITFDSREKKEEGKTQSFAVNVNATNILWGLIPIPLGYPWSTDYLNQFNSATATKIIQQYGILKEVVSYNEGAITTVRNEVFDPITGQALITSVDNEFKDREYTMNYPAYWANRGMEPSYINQGYEADYPVAKFTLVGSAVHLLIPATVDNYPLYHVGDEVLMTCSINGGGSQSYNGWITELWGDNSIAGNYFEFAVAPRSGSWPVSTSATATNVHLKIIRSGAKNELQQVMQTYTGMTMPVNGNGYLSDTLRNAISLKATAYNNMSGAVYNTAQPLNTVLRNLIGATRVSEELVYRAQRNYAGASTRKAGLFDATSFYVNPATPYDNSIPHARVTDITGLGYFFTPTNYLRFAEISLNSSVVTRTITKYSPNGQELENVDAIGNFSAAQFGYNNQLPVAVAQNTRQCELLSDGFEDYGMLQVDNDWVPFFSSVFKNGFNTQLLATGSRYRKFLTSATIGSSTLNLVNTVAHTGYYSLQVGGSNLTITPTVKPVTGLESDYSYTPYAPPYERLALYPVSGKYIVSFWARPTTAVVNPGSYSMPMALSNSYKPKSGVIEGWQQFETTISATPTTTIVLPAGFYIDDIRVYPAKGNMKAYVYHPVTQKLMATLDENNYATLYEYDQEGNLVRTKKETSKGIATVSESRSAHPKSN